MKKSLLLLYLFLITSAYSQTKLTGVVHYESGISQQNIDNYFSKERKLLKNKERVKFMDNLLLNSKKVVSTLHFTLNEALFEVDKKLNTKDRGNITEKMSLIAAGGLNKYYQNTNTRTLETQNCVTLGECFIIVSPFKKWQLTQETKKIAGYLCYKATTVVTRNKKAIHITAWYCPQIPVSFGPKEYNGLPGLILEAQNNFRYLRATKLILNPKEKVLINKPTKGKKVSQKEYDKISKEAWAKFK
jgi:GLPGLI family protein